jgi:hypothetical protein
VYSVQDGGVLREIVRYKSVEKADMAEIDKMVPEVSKKFFPQVWSTDRTNQLLGEAVPACAQQLAMLGCHAGHANHLRCVTSSCLLTAPLRLYGVSRAGHRWRWVLRTPEPM